MDVKESIAYLWELSGESSRTDPWDPNEHLDPDPYNPDHLVTSSFGYRFYLRELNKAQNTLANWRTKKGRPIRFSKFQTRKNVKLGLDNTEATGITKVDDFTLRVTDPPTLDADFYIDAKLDLTITDDITGANTTQDFVAVMVEIGTVDGAGTTTSLDFTFREEIEGWTGIDQTATVDFYFIAFKIERGSVAGTGFSVNLPTYTRNVTSITSMNTGIKLKRAESKTRLYDANGNAGTPIEWYKNGEIIYLDTYIAEPLWYIFDYQRLPYELTITSTTFDIPVEWQDVIMMLVEMSTAKSMQEVERATILRSQINSLIGQLRTDAEEDWIGEETQGFYIRKGAR